MLDYYRNNITLSSWVLFILTTPDFWNTFENLMLVLSFFRFNMTKDIAYFLYIFGDNGANML